MSHVGEGVFEMSHGAVCLCPLSILHPYVLFGCLLIFCGGDSNLMAPDELKNLGRWSWGVGVGIWMG